MKKNSSPKTEKKIQKTAAKRAVLVTGGAGFIGSHLSKRLIDDGYKVVILDNFNNYYDPKLKRDRLKHLLAKKKFILEKVDITNFAALKKIFKKYKFDAVCHLAAQAGVRHSFVDPLAYGRTNILGTLNIFELSRKYNCPKVVFASSSSVYGDTEKVPFCEKNALGNPTSFYGLTKVKKETMGRAYHEFFGLKVVGLRFFTVYGPWGRPDMACYKFAQSITRGEPIDVYNFGKMKRDFTYIDDIIEGIVSALQKDFDFEIFNLGNNRSEELERFIGLLEEYLGKAARKQYLPLQNGDISATWADISKAKEMLDFNPKTSIEDGLKNFVDWYKGYHKIK